MTYYIYYIFIVNFHKVTAFVLILQSHDIRDSNEGREYTHPVATTA